MTAITPPIPSTDNGNNIGLYNQTAGSSAIDIATATYSNANVARYLPNYTGYIGGTLTSPQSQLVLSGNLDANAYWINNLQDPLLPQDAATKAYVDAHGGNGGGQTYYAGLGITFAGANNAYIDANVDDINIIIDGSNQISITNHPTFANVTATSFFGTATSALSATTATTAGTVTTAAQPNITSVGTLTSLTTSGNVNAGYYIGNGSLLTGIVVGNTANANYSNFSGIASVANSVAGANVTGAVTYAGIANSVAGANVTGAVAYAAVANSVSGANVNGAVAVANIADVANSVAGANVTGIVANANYSAFSGVAGTANSVAGSNVVGPVGLADFATTANAVAGANVSGQVGYAAVANSVAGANVSGQVGYSAIANSVAGSNVTGQVNYAAVANSVNAGNIIGTIANANYAAYAGNVTIAAQPNITSVGTLTGLSVGGNAVINGDLAISGNLVYVNVGSFNVKDPIIELGRGVNNAPLTFNDGKDRGTDLWYYDTAERQAFFGYDNSTGKLFAAKDVSIASEIVTINNYGNFVVGNLEASSVLATGNITGANFMGALANGTTYVSIPVVDSNIVANVSGTRYINLGYNGSNSYVAIGGNAGAGYTGNVAVYIGTNAGNNPVATGTAVAIGHFAGSNAQSFATVAVGPYAGSETQGSQTTAVGYAAGRDSQGANSTAVGISAGLTSQGTDSVAIGASAGRITQGTNSVAVGVSAGYTNQGAGSVAIGIAAGRDSQGANSIAIGISAGRISQSVDSVAVGYIAGNTAQGANSVAVGVSAAFENQSANSVAIGYFAGGNSQGDQTVAVGRSAGAYTQGENSVAVGVSAGYENQSANSIAIGLSAGYDSQGDSSIAIGYAAANSGQGANSIAIGRAAGYLNQSANSIVIVAGGAGLNAANEGLYINPVRNDTANLANTAFFNVATNEITYGIANYIANGTSNLTFSSADANIIGYSNGNLVFDIIYESGGNTRIAFGQGAGNNSTSNRAVYIGKNAGANSLAASAASQIAIGSNAGQNSTQSSSIAIGGSAGNALGLNGIAIGASAGLTGPQANNAIAIGTLAANVNQGFAAIAIGQGSANLNQGSTGIAIGVRSANTSQGANAVAIGYETGRNTQSANAVAIGLFAGTTTQGANSVAIGYNAGNTNQGANSVAIGPLAGSTNQGANAVAIGYEVGRTQGAGAVAIGGASTANNQGANSIAIGYSAVGNAQAAGSIALNATGTVIVAANAGTYIAPVRSDNVNYTNAVYYNTGTKELTYSVNALQKPYGQFWNTTTQTNPVASTAMAMTLDTSDITVNVSVVSGTQITTALVGKYNLQFSAQISKSGGTASYVDIWFRKNGTNLVSSNTRVYIQGGSAAQVAAWNFLLNTTAANDYYEIMWSSPDTDVSLLATGTQISPTRPATPSLIVTVTTV